MYKRMISLLLAIITFVAITFMVATPVSAATEMHISEQGIAYLKKAEGFSKYPYWDASQWTVGYGTRCPDNKLEEYKKNGISEKDAEALFKEFIASFETYVNKFINNNSLTVTQNQYDMLVCFSYNVGPAWMSQSSCSLRKAIVNKSSDEVFVQELVLWSKTLGSTSTALVERRIRDANMWLNGDYTTWRPEDIGYVYYSLNGGDLKNSVQTFLIKDGVISKTPLEYNAEGFTGWYTQPIGGQKVEKLTKELIGKTLFAHWGEEENVESNLESPVVINVTASGVNLREGPGTNYKRIGSANTGDVLTITQTCETLNRLWGKSEKGWICLEYTNFNKALEDPNDTVIPEETTPPTTESEKETEPEPVPEETKPSDENKETPIKSGAVKVSDSLRIRKEPSTSAKIQGHLKNGDKVEIYETKENDNMIWGRIGENKWISLSYVTITEEKTEENVEEETIPETPDETMPEETEPPAQEETQPEEENTPEETKPAEPAPEQKPVENKEYITDAISGTINVAEALRIRKDAGTTNEIIGYYHTNDRVSISSFKTVGSTTWGKTEAGWVSLDYVRFNLNGTIKADCLRVRHGAGLGNMIVGFLYNNAKVKITEIKLADNMLWGKTSDGWISMDYVNITK